MREGFFTVVVQNGQDGNTALAITGGTVTSLPEGINCGVGQPIAGCTATFPLGTDVQLTAAVDATQTGMLFLGWSGDCMGWGTCDLTGNADKYLVASFGTARTGHPNWSEHAQHGPALGSSGLDCRTCHGANLTGAGIALGCNTCHTSAQVAEFLAFLGRPQTPGILAEACSTCHAGQGASHQAAYNRYTDASTMNLTIDSIVSTETAAGSGVYTSVMTVTVTKGALPFTGGITASDNKTTFYATTYDSATRKFDTTVNYKTPTETATPGTYTVTATQQTNGSGGTNASTALSFRPEDGPTIAFAYVTDDQMPFEAFPVYDNVASASVEYGLVEYTSTANVSACEKCHGSPYMKHGYRQAQVTGLDDFAACKVCHYDTRNGGHQAWQLLVDDPAAYAAQGGATTADQNAKYPYKASVMNDVHMSHAMEFAYPQSMANCTTCHEGKLANVLTAQNFTLATCKSCHPVTGVGGTDPKRAPALNDLMAAASHPNDPATGAPFDLYTTTYACNTCHSAIGFSALHTGFNPVIYANSAGTKYADAFTTAISSASITGNVLSFEVTVTEAIDTDVSVADLAPLFYVAPYGFDTKDFILASINQDSAAAAKAGWTVTAGAVVGTSKTWAVQVDLATAQGATPTWTDRIANNTINRVELGVRPKLLKTFPGDAAATTLATNFATRTFSLDNNAFDDAAFTPIVDANKCNACHEALATTFHSPDRGGSVVGCRICHVTITAGSHLEMQSRSIDSYVHAIHSMQPFDSGDVNFADPVAALRYDHHVESTYPNFTVLNCESCHNPGTYEAPSEAKSLPGLLSGNDVWDTGRTRTIGTVPAVVTGPAARACGSCHRSKFINEDAAAELSALNAHTGAFGYRQNTATGVFDGIIADIQAYIDRMLGP